MLSLKLILRAAMCLALVLPCSVLAQQTPVREVPQTTPAPMSNDDVIALVAAELPDDIVMAKIHAAKQTSFDTSVAGLKALKQAGVSSRVIRYMIDPTVYPRASTLPPPGRVPLLTPRPPGVYVQGTPVDDPDDTAEPHAPGVYLRAKGSDGSMHMTRLDHISAKNTRTTGTWLSGITYGTVPTHTKASIDGAHANVQTGERDPVFYAYIPEDSYRFGGNSINVRDLTLIRFDERVSTREIKIGSQSVLGASNGPDGHAKQGFTFQQIRSGVYEFKLNRPLAPGEYAFQHQNFGAFYDFGIASPN